jgi:hypothetical protein
VEQLNRIVHDPRNKVVKLECYGEKDEQWAEVRFRRSTPFETPSESTNTAWAAATTANARVRLHTMLNYLHHTQLMYCDTDSVILEYDPANPLHKMCDSAEVGFYSARVQVSGRARLKILKTVLLSTLL